MCADSVPSLTPVWTVTWDAESWSTQRSNCIKLSEVPLLWIAQGWHTISSYADTTCFAEFFWKLSMSYPVTKSSVHRGWEPKFWWNALGREFEPRAGAISQFLQLLSRLLKNGSFCKAVVESQHEKCQWSSIHEDIDLTYERDDGSIGLKITWSIYTLM